MGRSRCSSALLWLAVAGCAGHKDPPPCDDRPFSAGMEAVAASDLVIHLDAPRDPNIDSLSDRLLAILPELWGAAPAIRSGPPAFDTPRVLWLTTSSAALGHLGDVSPDGYHLRSFEAGASKVLLVYGRDSLRLSYGVHALLERLGVRFFHPAETYLPSLGALYLPTTLEVDAVPRTAVRGIHLHLLHPLEYETAFNGGSDADFAEAKRMLDWLVATGQNHVQWPIMITLPFAAWSEYAKRLNAYAHARGLTTGVVVQLYASSSLQNNYVLVRSSSQAWAPQIDDRLAPLMALGFDQIEVGLGEFVAIDADKVIAGLNEVVSRAAMGGVRASVVNHVGNFPALWLDYMGKKTFFYHLPAYADPRLIQSVHTVGFFDLYRDWATYGHDDFHLQHDYLIEQLDKHPVRYFPESAYWLGADNDVPLFLPEYIESRWNDLHRLDAEITAQHKPALEGHVMFSSGHEWGYWLTDYLIAHLAWAPERELDDLLGDYSGAFGSCADRAQGVLRGTIDLERKYLFEQRLIGYLAGEDLHYDLGLVLGVATHPLRMPYEKLLTATREERDGFEQAVLVPLEAMASELGPLVASAQSLCASSTARAKPWCAELEDGIEVLLRRTEHAAALYRAVLGAVRGTSNGMAELDRAATVRAQAAEVIARREAGYRGPLERFIGAYENPTVYKFGVMRQAHTQCFWTRQEQQARAVITQHEAPSPLDLPGCLE